MKAFNILTLFFIAIAGVLFADEQLILSTNPNPLGRQAPTTVGYTLVGTDLELAIPSRKHEGTHTGTLRINGVNNDDTGFADLIGIDDEVSEVLGVFGTVQEFADAVMLKIEEIEDANTGDQNLFYKVTGDTGEYEAESLLDVLHFEGAGVVSVSVNDADDGATITITGTGGEGGGDVIGPASSTDNAIVRFHEATGKIIQNSSALLSDAGLLTTSNIESGSSSFSGTVSATAAAPSYTFIGDTDTGVGSPEADAVGLYGGGELIATTDIVPGIANQWVITADDKNAILQVVVADNDTASRAGNIDAYRSRGTLSIPATVVDGDELWRFRARGHDGTAFRDVAGIVVRVDGGVGTNDLPTNITFQVTPDGSVSQIPALIISNQGTLIFRESSGSSSISSGNQMGFYVKNNKVIFKFNDGTTRYKYMDLDGTSTTWTYSATEP